MAPTRVLGEDGREIAEKLGDQDAYELAHKVHANTGETVTLKAYTLTEDGWVFDEKTADESTVPNAPTEDTGQAADGSFNLDEMTGKELDALAEKLDVADYKKSAKVAEKRDALAEALAGEGG